MNVYDFKVINHTGQEVSLREYAGQVLLIINSATECGFTPQYDDLQDLYEQYGEEGFAILDFPCDQFGQAPGDIESIHLFCSQRFGISFPIMDKVEVNGPDAHPLFRFLKEEAPFVGFNPDHPATENLVKVLETVAPAYKYSNDIKWNFTKFLVDRDGRVVDRFEPAEFSAVIEDAVRELL